MQDVSRFLVVKIIRLPDLDHGDASVEIICMLIDPYRGCLVPDISEPIPLLLGPLTPKMVKMMLVQTYVTNHNQ